MNHWRIILAVIGVGGLAAGTLRDPHFWQTADQRGDALMRQHKFAEAAKAYSDPQRIAVAQYRNGDFEAAAKTFARVPGAVGAFDQGNALLMHGKYDAAIERYDRALSLRPEWIEAKDNRAIAVARKAKIEGSGKNREEEAADAYKPDEIALDQKGGDQKGKPIELSEEELSDDALRATWLRQVHTTPGDFLKAKFAFQAAQARKGGTDATTQPSK